MENGRRRLILPRPRLVNVIELVESIQRADAKEFRTCRAIMLRHGAAAPCAQIPPRPQRFFNELKSHPGTTLEKIEMRTKFGTVLAAAVAVAEAILINRRSSFFAAFALFAAKTPESSRVV